MSKYQPITLHLETVQGDVTRLTFSEIENLIGEALPESALHYHAWWANSQTKDSHSWAHLWLKAGWRKSRLSFDERWVEFSRVEHFELDDPKAREGYLIDRKILTKSRNRLIAQKRKELDNFTCQACSFCFALNGRYVIEVHHINPLGLAGETVTSLDDLVCLCPTCHRIAHLRSEPYGIAEIRTLRTKES